MTNSTIALISFICILIADIIVVLVNSEIRIISASTELVAALNFISVVGLLILGFKFRWKDKMPYSGLLVFKLFMAWSLFEFVRGVFNAHDYWDWKFLFLNYSFTILVPMAIVVGLNYETNGKTFRFILDRLFIFGFIFIPFALATNYQLYARVVTAVSLFILFVPYLKFRWRVLIFVVAIVSVASVVSYRSNTLRILIPMFLLLVYFSRQLIKTKVLNIVASVLFCLPLMFLYLGVTGQFNVFNENIFDYEVSDTATTTKNLSSDTRTFLYKEVTFSMLKRDSSFIVGEGGGAAYETDAFSNLTLNERGRYGSEVGFLNTLLYSGAVGVVLYGLMLFVPAYYAINRSSNYLCKMLGLFLAFHWVIFFFEDFTRLDMNYYFIWLVIGLCLSKKFRALTDVEVKQFFNLNAKQASKNVGNYRDPRLTRRVQ
jgi:hypothetical protein